jgi:hypothetical protein
MMTAHYVVPHIKEQIMKLFNFFVTFGLVVFSASGLATESERHNSHKARIKPLHMASNEENALTFLSNKADFSKGRHWNQLDSSLLSTGDDISDEINPRDVFGKGLSWKLSEFNNVFEHDFSSYSRHHNKAGFGYFNHAFQQENIDFNWSRHNPYCHLPVTAPVPEPETYALMIAGLLLVGAATRRNA